LLLLFEVEPHAVDPKPVPDAVLLLLPQLLLLLLLAEPPQGLEAPLLFPSGTWASFPGAAICPNWSSKRNSSGDFPTNPWSPMQMC